MVHIRKSGKGASVQRGRLACTEFGDVVRLAQREKARKPVSKTQQSARMPPVSRLSPSGITHENAGLSLLRDPCGLLWCKNVEPPVNALLRPDMR
jgi:hypothetical protein